MPDKEITIPEIITVRDLATEMNETPIKIIKTLMSNGVLASINQQIDFDTAAIIAEEFGFEAKQPYAELEEESEQELSAWQVLLANEDEADLRSRPPVVTVLGHVDHGKTSLLDAFRHTKVQEGETGGITQHIGAYQIKHDGRRITFLDTPGHEAFTAMRARGANTTDIAVLVVAADDGVQPQTVEAINHARAAHVPILVALNKMDRPNARPEVVKNELAEHGLMPDDWGGTTMVIPCSAKMRTGLDDLLEAIILIADEINVRANPEREAVGTVLEGRLDKRRGPLATILVQNGTLRTGDVVVVGNTWGKARALEDENDVRHRTAPPATPTVIIGLHDVPAAGDRMEAVQDERTARAIAEKRTAAARKKELTRSSSLPLSLDDISNAMREGQIKELNVVLKTDVQGSIEPIVNSIERLSSEDAKVSVIHAAAGNISESDINLAIASQAILIGFRVSADSSARRMADREEFRLQIYDIIYGIIDDVEKALKGMLDPTFAEKVLGRAEVRQVFDIPRLGKIAGCYVRTGLVRRNSRGRLLRNKNVIHEADVESLKRFAKDAREVKQNYECGIRLFDFDDYKVGDVLEFYTMVRVEQE